MGADGGEDAAEDNECRGESNGADRDGGEDDDDAEEEKEEFFRFLFDGASNCNVSGVARLLKACFIKR